MPDNRGLGWKWIRPEKRFAIYFRDGFTCTWCGAAAAPAGYGLTLDHLDGNHNDADNLVTACNKCNASRGQTPLRKWLRKVGRPRPRPSKQLDKEMGRKLAALRRQHVDAATGT